MYQIAVRHSLQHTKFQRSVPLVFISR